MKEFMFQLKVLWKSLQLPLSFIVIFIYSFVFCFAVMFGLVSFIELNTKYLDLNEWNYMGRAFLLVFSLLMTFAIFGIKNKFFK